MKLGPHAARTDLREGLAAELERLERCLAAELARLDEEQRESELVGLAILPSEVTRALVELRREQAEAELDEAHLSQAVALDPSAPCRFGLDHAQAVFGLSDFERDLLIIGLCVELDLRYARIIAYLNDHMERTRPTVGLALRLLGVGVGRRVAALERLGSEQPLRRFGLLELLGDGPLPTRALRVPADLWPRLIAERDQPGRCDGSYRVERQPLSLDDLVLPKATRSAVQAAVDWLTIEYARALLVLRGPTGSGREGLARAIGSALGRPTITVGLDELASVDAHPRLRRELRWSNAVLIVAADRDPSSTSIPTLPTDLPGPVLWIDQRAAIERLELAASGRVVRTVELQRLGVHERARVWAQVLAPDERAPELDLDSFAAVYRFGPGRITAAVGLARASRAAPAGEPERIDAGTLERACRELPSSRIATLAQRLAQPYSRADLVVEPEIRRELDLVRAWARHGHRVFGSEGRSAHIASARGLACLFAGPPGTGKTMAAQVLASELRVELYRVDLSIVVDKYIGETEKNLSRVFDEAEAAGAMLFFDEADALFGKRSEVKDAHDRYANVEVGFLLQRLEVHEGITVLATNLKRNIDDAFLRRLQIVAEFPLPKAEQRKLIWERHLPVERADDIDLELLGSRFELAGGDIRNAVLAAALFAADEHQPIGMAHLVRGLVRELRKGGRLIEPERFGAWAQLIDGRR